MLDEFCLNPCRWTLNLDKLACFGFSLRCSWMQQTTASFLWCRLSHVLTAFRFGCYTYFSIWDATQKHLETLFSSVSSLSLSVLSLGLSAALSSSRSLCRCHWTVSVQCIGFKFSHRTCVATVAKSEWNKAQDVGWNGSRSPPRLTAGTGFTWNEALSDQV